MYCYNMRSSYTKCLIFLLIFIVLNINIIFAYVRQSSNGNLITNEPEKLNGKYVLSHQQQIRQKRRIENININLAHVIDSTRKKLLTSQHNTTTTTTTQKPSKRKPVNNSIDNPFYNVIDVPRKCPDGQNVDEDGNCRDIWYKRRKNTTTTTTARTMMPTTPTSIKGHKHHPTISLPKRKH